ncbi:hypothetical protein I2492_10880 [Budviciaceae bacterium CWB-B4]|uniref:Uncharacterized protein n=1 Tax=Limnobaculum xujianqingii TaxID=2738837 RepID=A0A9D7FY16_9GAMM|nr:hypothetical protein [Limnobaculum xujianqingii]MBK5073444.1 hypothetical protein [Limnobaculum xujianqingii]MBK5176825.1 hypothetical protein [Limnobaculum xujianqingii]
MGAYFDIGYKKPSLENYGERTLSILLNRVASGALEMLFDEALKETHPVIHEIIMEVLVLDQISFTDLNKTDFNVAVQAIRDCIASRKEPTEWQTFQKNVWEAQIEPLIQQDECYQQG